MKSGFIYVLVHPSDPDLYKIGITTRKPEQRLAQHTWGKKGNLRSFERSAVRIRLYAMFDIQCWSVLILASDSSRSNA